MSYKTKLNPDILESNIKLLISKNGITQDRLARDINMSQSKLNKRLKGHLAFSIDEIYDIANYFGVSIDSLCSNSFAEKLNMVHSPILDNRGLNSIERYHKVCAGLADIFKHARLINIGRIAISEAVFEFHHSEGHPRGAGTYSRKPGMLGNDPTNEYSCLYFPNYYPLKSSESFSSDEEEDEYAADLMYCGNHDEENIRTNKFLKKLIDLNAAYKNDSLTYEDYVRSIDTNLSKVLSET